MEREPTDRPTDEDPPGEPDTGAREDHPDGFLDRLRDTGVGVEDPNIVGDAGPVDIPPGRDGDELIEDLEPDDHRRRPEV